MPELPEVETITRDLKKGVLERTFLDVWTDWEKTIKKPKDFAIFKKEIKGKKIEKIFRRGKNILFELSGDKTLLVHQKLTGHLLLGKWEKKDKAWKPVSPGPLEDPMNRFLHLIFWLDDEKQLALSDLRKFAKVELWDTKALMDSEGIKSLGPDPLSKFFTFEKFLGILRSRKGKIKQVLLNQTVIAGIGNIYSDEILFAAKIHPFQETSKITLQELKRIYKAMREVLKDAVALRGESISDYRDLSGRKGNFDKIRKVYRREKEKCPRCKNPIKRVKIGGRSAHYCPNCQKLR